MAETLKKEQAPKPAARILLVEDNPDDAQLIEWLLRRITGEITLAETGPQALGVARQLKPDLILCDIMLPGMSGERLAAEMRAQMLAAHMPQAPIVAITGHGGRERLLASGFDGFIAKTLPPDEIAREVSRYLV